MSSPDNDSDYILTVRHTLHDIDAEHNNLRNMLRGMITHPLHVLLKAMPTPLILGNDGRHNKMTNMSR
eukprot:7545378-Ditylum_brightwellii.AAC.1